MYDMFTIGAALFGVIVAFVLIQRKTGGECAP